MPHIRKEMLEGVKKNLSPLAYYEMTLKTTAGRPTGFGWHRWKGCCPFHDDKKPGSFHINLQTGAYKCFSCGEGGSDIIDFQMKYHKEDFLDAVLNLQFMRMGGSYVYKKVDL